MTNQAPTPAKGNALPGSRRNMFMLEPEWPTLIGRDTKDGPEHELFDPRVKEPYDEKLVCSIAKNGVLQNITVRKNGDALEVVYGRRRVIAAREANRRFKEEGSDLRVTVPSVLEKSNDSVKLFGMMVAENEIRKGDEALRKAEKADRMATLGAEEEEIAVAFGVTTTTIKNWAALMSLCKPVKEAVNSGQISASAAAKLAGLSNTEQVTELETLKTEAGSKPITNASVSHAVKKKKSKAKGNEDAIKAPSKKVVKKVLASDDVKETLSDDFIKGVRWAIGDLQPTTISGLTLHIREAEGKNT